MPFTGYGAFTAPINPSGATPVITYDQVWKALVFKAGKPQAFVPVIDQCNVVSRSESGLTRKVIFKEGKGPAEGWVTEEITFLGNSRVDFLMVETGYKISNVLTQGPGGDDDLYLTYDFLFTYPDIQEGTPEAEAKKQELLMMSRGGVTHGIVVIRDLVQKGEI